MGADSRLRNGTQQGDRATSLLDRFDGRLGRAVDLEGQLRLEFADAEDLHAVARLGDHTGGNQRLDRHRSARVELAGLDGLLVADVFFENVEGPDGKNRVLAFTPRAREPMLIACLWSHWTDPKGLEPDLLSFAAITDEPEPEVAAAGHDRTIINIKPEHIDAWLNPDPANLAALHAIFDDKRHPYYEHREAA